MPRDTAPRAAVFAASLAVLAAGCDLGGEDRVGGDRAPTPHTLTMLNPFTAPEGATDFADEVARLSHGALRVRIIPAGYAGRRDYEAATIRDMLQGRADLATAGSRAWDEFGVRGLRALHAPLLIDSYLLQERALQSGLATRSLAELRRLGFVGIGILPGPMRRPLGLGHRLATPAEFRGLTIGVQQSRIADATMRTLGARPLRLPARIPSLDGLDGVEHRVGSIESDRLDVESSHLMTNVNLWPRPLVLFAAGRSYGRLTAGQRQVLSTAVTKLVPKATTLLRSSDAEASGDICRRGRLSFDTATAGELRALRRAVEPVYRDLERDPTTRAAIKAIERLKKQLAQPPAGLPTCHRGAEPPASGATAIDGIWRMDTDRHAAGADYQAENWGRWIYVFDRGRFAITQENQEACTWGYGTFSVVRSQMTWTFVDGGGIAPNEAQNKPGERFVFGLSVYRDTLTVTPVKGAISPSNFREKPWRRLSSTPSRRFFSKRCPPPAAALRA
jgi:TRAP-type C4-dicarboxylate transport system substrate-binding protein